jgi:hypothetical protein
LADQPTSYVSMGTWKSNHVQQEFCFVSPRPKGCRKALQRSAWRHVAPCPQLPVTRRAAGQLAYLASAPCPAAGCRYPIRKHASAWARDSPARPMRKKASKHFYGSSRPFRPRTRRQNRRRRRRAALTPPSHPNKKEAARGPSTVPSCCGLGERGQKKKSAD